MNSKQLKAEAQVRKLPVGSFRKIYGFFVSHNEPNKFTCAGQFNLSLEQCVTRLVELVGRENA